MKVSSVVPLVILGAEVALAVPAASEDHALGAVLDDRETPCIAKGNCGGIYTPEPGPEPTIPAQAPETSICFVCIGRRAESTLVTVTSYVPADDESTPGAMGFFGPKIAARQTTTTVEPQVTKGSIGFVGPKLKERAQEGFLGPNLKPRVPLATPAPGAILKLDDRETPCIAENDCGGINTQSPASSSVPATSAPPSSTSAAPPTPLTTTLPNALTPVPSPDWGTLIAPPTPAESCWEATNGQVHCVPYGSPSPASSGQKQILPKAVQTAF